MAGEPSHVIGPNAEGLVAGDNATILGTYCAPGCLLREFTRDGQAATIAPESELGHPVFSSRLRLGSGESTTLSYRWTTPGGWLPDEDGGLYRLTVRDQVTIRPTRLELSVALPEGMAVVATSHPMQRAGAQLTWAGEIHNTEVFEIQLRRPLREVAAERIRAWANRPLLVNAVAAGSP